MSTVDNGSSVELDAQISMAQAGFYALGAYAAGAATAMWGWPIAPAVLFGALVGGAFGFLVGFPALRVRGLFLVIATLAFTEIVRMVFLKDYSRFENAAFDFQ